MQIIVQKQAFGYGIQGLEKLLHIPLLMGQEEVYLSSVMLMGIVCRK